MAVRAWKSWRGGADFKDRTAKAFSVGVDEIRKNSFDLSIGRYKEVRHEEETFDPPKVILQRMRQLENNIQKDLTELEGMFR